MIRIISEYEVFSMFIQVLSGFHSEFIRSLSGVYPDSIQIPSGFQPDSIQILSGFYLGSIRIDLKKMDMDGPLGSGRPLVATASRQALLMMNKDMQQTRSVVQVPPGTARSREFVASDN